MERKGRVGVKRTDRHTGSEGESKREENGEDMLGMEGNGEE